jgi:pilus assembly protein CpaB
MTRETRTLTVVLVAVVTAGLASFGVYNAIRQMPVREIEVAHSFVVAAAHNLPIGASVTASDLKLVAWPNSAPVPGAFAKMTEVLNRGIVAPVQENELVTESKLASAKAGAGLAPTIPQGMRAISVRVNEVVGVAGFVTPGTRVDVFATFVKGEESVTRVVVSNVQVLTAGTRYDQEQAKSNEPIPSSVVTLLLSPGDAERVVLASTAGQLMLALRNPLDTGSTDTAGTRSSGLFGEAPQAIVTRAAAAPANRAVTPQATAEVPAPPAPYTVEAIRAAARSVEAVRRKFKD